jgi:Na+/H+ antiporter NhaD/arsenite permease-like protein
VKILRKTLDKKTLSVSKAVKRITFGIIPFVLGMFITVKALRIYGVSQEFGLVLRNVSG